jgi:hypothetical protein
MASKQTVTLHNLAAALSGYAMHPQYVVEELLQAEGFADISYVGGS